jgi:hypothetical protein
MGVSHEAAQKLVNEMNDKVFKKIKEELIKITETKKLAAEKAEPQLVAVEKSLTEEFDKAGIEITGASATANDGPQVLESREEILGKIERPAPVSTLKPSGMLPAGNEPHPLLAQKLSGPMQVPSSKTVHSLDNLTKPSLPSATTQAKTVPDAPQRYSEDPYREKPE